MSKSIPQLHQFFSFSSQTEECLKISSNRHIVVLRFKHKIILRNVHIKLHVPTLHGSSIAPTLYIYLIAARLIVLLAAGNYKYKAVVASNYSHPKIIMWETFTVKSQVVTLPN